MVTEKSWDEFRSIGLLLIINQTLHIFGWAIVMEIDSDDGHVTRAYPARVKFRGFDEKSNEEAYIKVSEFMKANADDLLAEARNDA
jgi:hypothetical protein